MAVTIAGTTYEVLDTAFAAGGNTPAAGIYHPTGRPPEFGQPPREGAPFYHETEASFPGTNGVAIIRHGFRGRMILIDLCIIGATKAAVETSKNTLFNALEVLARFSITVPGGTARAGCRLVQPAIVERWDNISTMIYCAVSLVFRQYSE